MKMCFKAATLLLKDAFLLQINKANCLQKLFILASFVDLDFLSLSLESSVHVCEHAYQTT